MSTDKKISTIVDQQFPFFVRDDGPNLIAFVKAYYEWTEQANNAIEVSKNLLNYQDIDSTYEKYLEFFHREIMDDIPRDVLANRNKLAKHIKDLYRARGSELSYRLLFRVLYDEEIEFYYPGEDILRASDGRWVLENTIRVGPPKSASYSTEAFQNKSIVGLTSGATARIDNIVAGLSSGVLVDEFYLIDIDGTFQDNEKVALSDDNTVFGSIFAVSGPLQGVTVQKGGAFHQEGDSVKFLATTGSGANGVVVETTGDSAVQWSIERGGSGYSLDATITINHGSGLETAFTIDTLANTEVIPICQDTILPMANVVLNTGPKFVSLGANTSSVSANLALANVSSTIISGLNFVNTTFGTINSISTTNYGYGYSPTLPSATVVEESIAALNTPDPDGGYKGKNAVIISEHAPGAISTVRVANFGSDYSRYESVTIQNLTRAGTQSAVGVPNISGVVNYPGKYIDTKGWLSWNNKLQDNYYYQEFSYEIKSDQFTNTYRQLVQDILHPAGTKMFGRIRLYSGLDTTVVSIDQSSIKYNIESEFSIDIPTVVSDTESEYIETVANTSPEITYNTLEATTTVATAETDILVFTLGTGNLFIANSALISAYAAVTVNAYANVPISLLGSSSFVYGNNTIFQVEVPSSNTRLLIVDSVRSTNGAYFTNATYSNTSLSLKTNYFANTLSNAVFYVANTSS